MSHVAVLCASLGSVYHEMDECEVYDRRMDARTFPKDAPVVAHPPCRAWSAFTRHQAKPEPGEKDLGLWCCEVVRECGGILEQPAHSTLFAAADLPLPGQPSGPLFWSVEVDQSAWGFPTRKKTWLFFTGIERSRVGIPTKKRDHSGDRRRWQVMSKKQRAATHPRFAKWLVKYALLIGETR